MITRRLVRRVLYFAACVIGGAAIVLLFVNPNRDLLPVVALLCAAVALCIVAMLLKWRGVK